MTLNAKLLIVALDLRLMARQLAIGQSSTLFEHTLPDRLTEAADSLKGLVRNSVAKAVQSKLH